MDSYQEMQEDMNNGAKLIGVFNKSGELIAYRYIAFPGESDRNLGNDINLTRRELINVAHLETTVVHPAYRGNSLQSLTLQEAIPILRNCGCEHLLCTVSPQNPYSLYNVMKNGLRIRALKKKYGSDKTGKDGIWRFILHRSLVQEEVRKVNLIYSIPLMNLERQRELIKKGYIGLQMLRENQLLNYVRFEGSII
jgi:GNAT superfamily N-acetyltransferase